MNELRLPYGILCQSSAQRSRGRPADDADDRKLLAVTSAAAAAKGLDLPVINIIIDITKTMKISQAFTTDEHFRKAGFSALLVD
ncbi:MAG: hypothetical protein ACLQU3_06335 [Limisphaerales bacterium]